MMKSVDFCDDCTTKLTPKGLIFGPGVWTRPEMIERLRAFADRLQHAEDDAVREFEERHGPGTYGIDPAPV